MNNNNKLLIAEDYISHGYSVIPIIPLSKKPVKAWKEYTVRYATSEELHNWYVTNDYDIAIVTGKISNLTVVDIDDNDTYQLLINKYSQIPNTPTVKTRKGYHLYFQYINTPCKINRDAKIDIKSDNGYVVAPPSKHLEGNYTFIVPIDTEKAVCPQFIFDYINSFNSNVSRISSISEAIDAIYTAGVGERNDTLFKASCRAFEIAIKNNMHIHTLVDRLVAAGEAIGLPHSESNATVTSALKHATEAQSHKIVITQSTKVLQKDIVEALILKHKDTLRYVSDAQCWYRFDGKCWRQITTEQINSVIIEMLNTVLPTYTITTVNSIRQLLACNPNIMLKLSDFDKWHNIIVFNNGAVDICNEKLELLPHSNHYYNTSCLPYDFDINAQCPHFNQFLKDSFSDDVADFVLQFIGLCFTSDTRFETALFLYSDIGGAGKSTLLNVIQNLLVDKCGLLPIHKLTERFGKISLIGKTAILATETSSEMLQNCDILNSIISGESILIEPKHKEAFEYRPIAKLIYASNNLPKVSANDGAFYGLYRRLKIIKMEPVPQEKRDIYLRDKLQAETAGIAVLALKALQTLYKQNKFAVIKQIEDETLAWCEESNSVVQFIKDCCITEKGIADTTSHVYAAYRNYCRNSGFKEVSKTVLARQLKRLGYEQTVRKQDKIATRCWCNIAVSNYYDVN